MAGTARPDGSAGSPGSGGATIDAGPGVPNIPIDAASANDVCARWRADRANLGEGTWSGNIAACDPGDISADGRANALRLFNLYRWLADLPPVVNAADRDQQAQACALMMDANNMLSHDPPTTWTCYTQVGHDGAASSNISGGPGVSSVDAYLIDTGNETTFGHRRIVLSNELGPIGLGSTGTGGASCMQNLRGTGTANKPWLAWPPPGIFPLQAYAPRARSSLTITGWSFQANRSMALTNAQVAVTSGGTNLPMTVTQLTGTYGNNNAISMVPNGWDVAAGQTYDVSITGIATPVNYRVQIVSCN